MKNLTTRKLVFGLLMAFVLAFGVQGIADAQSTSQGTTTIYAATTPITRSFTITVTGAVSDDEVRITLDPSVEVTELDVTTAPTGGKPAKDTYTSNDTNNGIEFVDPAGDNKGYVDISFTPNGTKSWTIKVTYEVNKFGYYKLETTSKGSLKSSDSGLIEAYVVQSKGKAASYEIDKRPPGGATKTPQEGHVSQNIEVKVVKVTIDENNATIITGNAWVQVDVSISSGKLHPTGEFLSSSKIYAQNDANTTGYTSLSVFTDSDGKIDVGVSPDRNKTATVTAKISGTSGDHASHTVTYFENPVAIERVSGNYQHARTGDRLPQPLVVRVLDGSRKIRNQRVRFTASTGGRLYAVSSSDLIRESAEGGEGLSVKTNSSGEAKVYLRVPQSAGVVTVNAQVDGTPPISGATVLDELGDTNQFTVFAVQRQTGSSRITASTPTPAESSDPNYNPIYLTTSTPTTEVEFTITGGQLYLKPELLDLDGGSLGQRDDKPKYVSSLKISSNANGNIGTSDDDILFAKVTSGIATVTARITGTSQKSGVKVIQIIAGNLDLQTVSGGTPRIGGVPNGFRKAPFVVRASVGGKATSGQIVKFTTNEGSLAPVPGTQVFLTGRSTYTLAAPAGDSTPNSLLPASPNVVETILREEQYSWATGNNSGAIFVETDNQGEAKVYLKMGATAGAAHTVTAQLPVGEEEETFRVQSRSGNIAARLQKIDVPDIHSNDEDRDTLAVRVQSLDGDLLPDANIRWTTTDDGTISLQPGHGTITDRAARESTHTDYNGVDSGEEIFVLTDDYGEAWVTYLKDEDKKNQTVRAELASEQGNQQYDFEVSFVTFNIGSTTTNQTTQTTTTQTTTTVGGTGDDPEPDEIEIVSGDDQTGVPGTALSDPFVVRVIDDAGEPVENVRVYFDIDSGGGRLSRRSQRTDDDGEAETILTLGASAGENKVTATLDDDDLNVDDVEFTATAIAQPEEIAIVSGNNQTGSANRALSEAFVVKVTDESGNPVENVRVTFRVRSGPGLFPGGTRITDTTNTQGIAESQRLALTATAFGTVRVTAEAGGAGSVTFTVNAGDPPDALISISGNNQSGAPGSKLKAPFVVEVLDKDDEPMSGVTVIFKITAGGGKIAPTRATTNSSGRAQTTLTLGKKGGNNTVVASVAGLSRTVTFKAKASAIVLVNAAERPPLYWISSSEGTLHRLVEDQTEDLASNVKGVTSLAIDTQNSLLYFGVKTSAETGAIRRSNLNGSNVRTVLSFASVPKDIALDSNGSTLYLVTAGGHLQKVNTQGAARLVTIRQNLPALSAIAVSNGYVYWAEMLGRLRRISLTAKNPAIQDLVTGLDAPISLSISKGKLYWMQRSAQGDGRLQHANLDGTNIQSLKYFASGPPAGFTVNTSENKIYWTLDDGKIQQANIWGQSARDLVAGLPNPGAIAVGTRAAQAPVTSQPTQTTQTTTQQTTQQPTTYSKYDVNKDGKINNADTRAVAVAVGQSGNAITNPRTDVDGSGTVDVTDIILVLANLDDDVAAPAIDVDFKALDVDFDRVQEQVEMLLASGDRSIAAQRALLYLQHLLASARPDETALLANYPNPFNPETWIPYHLAESTPVRINIYDAQGILIRALTVGHQSAGYYTSRSRAAYWDGRNALGERVASGIYFYQLQTDALSPLRKMVILK